MRRAPRPARGRVAGALLAGALAAVAVAPASVGAQEPPTPTPVAPQLDLVERPTWASPTDRLTFALAVTGAVGGTSVQVEVFSALDSVEELVESETEDVGVRLSRTSPAPVESLVPGPDGARLVTIDVAPEPVDGLTTQLVEPGVHPVVISLLGAGGEVLDEVRTPLVRLGDDDDPWAAPDLAVLLDVDSTPTLRPDGTRSLRADELDRLVRVGALLAAHPELDLTIAAVPDTLDALATLTEPGAAALLEQLAGRDVLAAPYVRLPVAELVDHRLDGLVAPLVARGTALLADQLRAEPRPDVWDGELPPGVEGSRLLADLGYERIVVPGAPGDDDAVDRIGSRTDPPPLLDSGPRDVAGAGSLLAMIADPVLSAELAEPLPDRVDATHVALARYLLRPAEDDPGVDEDADPEEESSTTVLVRPGALAERSTLAGLLELLDDPLAPVRVGGLDLVDPGPVADPTGEGEEDPPAVPDVRWASDAPELGPVAPRVLGVAAAIESYAALVRTGSPRPDDVRLQVATAVAVDTSEEHRQEAMAAAEGAIAGAFEDISLSGQANLNLTSRRGTLPVTVENANEFPVDVLVRVRSERLRFGDGDAFTITVGANDLRRIDIPVEARATGSVPVFVELWTPDDGIQLTFRRLNVRSTAFSGVGLVLSLGAVLVLLTWWVRHSLAVRRERAAEAGAGGTSDRDDGTME